MVVSGQIGCGAQHLERAEGVVAGQARWLQAASERVEPHRTRPGQDPDAVAVPDRRVVAHPFGVVPHAVLVDHACPGVLGDADHASVDVSRDAGDHVLRCPAESRGPVPADEVVVRADAAAGHHHGLGPQREVADDLTTRGHPTRGIIRREQRSGDADDRAVLDDQGVDAVAVTERQQPVRRRVAGAVGPRLADAGSGAPRDVEAGDGVAVAARHAVAALGPADERGEPHTVFAQPGALLAGGELDVGPTPLHGPLVLGVLTGQPVPPRAALPVVPRQLDGVADAQASLFGGVDEEQPAEGPVGLAADVVLVLLIDDDDALARADQFVRGDEPGQAGSHDDDVGVHSVPLSVDGSPK
ncbi:hypothetical protein GCM10025883_43770 [Mobilicoccus caccae]|uniref:Uncharacterized protein n=1 Tax=Mobilicoccus caccae TaxID=1859295 RepID=A0ABQ6IYU1_9MICO|nr:hypothetical protein GCM10025883_43770 [Mobilicoccus caccae]